MKWRQQLSRKRIQNNDSEDDPGFWENNGGKDLEDARNQRPTRTKEQANRDEKNTLEGVNSRITEQKNG